jgi:hypothetical protein
MIDLPNDRVLHSNDISQIAPVASAECSRWELKQRAEALKGCEWVGRSTASALQTHPNSMAHERKLQKFKTSRNYRTIFLSLLEIESVNLNRFVSN